MSTSSRTPRFRGIAVLASGALIGTLLAAAPAQAKPNANPNANPAAQCTGRTVPVNKISFQLYSYAGWQRQIGTEAILAELADIGYRNVEPFGSSYEGRSASEFRDLLHQFGMRAPSAHSNTNPSAFDATLDFAKELGQKYVGSGGWAGPISIARDGSSTYADAVAVAEALNELGERSVKNGTGKVFGHNHQQEFLTQVTNPETGEVISAWEVIAQNIDPRWVTLQLDIYWAMVGGADPVALLEEYGNLIELVHVKDGEINDGTFGPQTNVGEGDIDWGPILRAAHGSVKYYVIERDGAPADAEFAQESFDFLSCFSY